MGDQWEYAELYVDENWTVGLPGGQTDELVGEPLEVLNELGRDGWEFVCVEDGTYWLKRRVA